VQIIAKQQGTAVAKRIDHSNVQVRVLQLSGRYVSYKLKAAYEQELVRDEAGRSWGDAQPRSSSSCGLGWKEASARLGLCSTEVCLPSLTVFIWSTTRAIL
jgi:hypothetical protein